LLPYIRLGLETLWLLAVLLVPLVFLNQDYATSEAKIGYVEIPKVALLRTLAGLAAILWVLEWAIRSRAFLGAYPSTLITRAAGSLRPANRLRAFGGWLKGHPTRWLLLAAGMFFGCTFLSTLLSGSVTNSMWGEIPGQDGYSAYTIASYGILFGVIATHMKERAQFGRLLAAIVLMGVLVGLYGTLQHYGHDFLGVTETTGGGTGRVTIFMGNTIFAAAVLSMTVPLTLLAAAINLHDDNWDDWGQSPRLGQSVRDSVLTSVWALLLAVQLLGLMFTFSRGPWAGTVLALIAFLVLLLLSSGWRMLVRSGLVIGLSGVFAVSLLHWGGNVTVIDAGAWLGITLALVGLAGVFAIQFLIRNFGRTVIFVAVFGAVITIVGTAVLAPAALSGRGSADSMVPGAETDSAASQVIGRIASAKTEVLSGFTGGRGEHWKISLDLIIERPWFEFDHLSLPWMRPLIGYGPDLFRYTYLLKSPPGDQEFMPLHPDHAHNFFVHQTVEQGIFGGLAAFGIFFSVFGVAGHHLLRRRRSANPLYRLVLLGLTAIILGRFLEMMVGVARVSDLTVLWVVFGLFVASASLDDRNQGPSHSVSSTSTQQANQRERRRASRASTAPSFSSSLIVRLAIVAWLVGGIGVVTWQKGINPVRASIAEGRALKSYQQGDIDGTVRDLDKAIKLAPGIPTYYYNRANVVSVYQFQPDAFTEPGCDQQNESPYLVCLGLQRLNYNLESVDRQPFNFRARLAAGNSAYNLKLTDLAIEAYSAAAAMVPNSYGIRNDLAESQINAGLYSDALTELEWSLKITGESGYSTRALFLKGKALKGLGRLDQASEALRQGLNIFFDSGDQHQSDFAQDSLKLLSNIDTEKGIALAIESYDTNISQNPQDAISYYLRGQAKLTLGEPENAVSDITESINLGLNLTLVDASRVYADLRAGGTANEAIIAMEKLAVEEPWNAWIPTYLGEFHASMGRSALALNSLETANALDPELGLAYLVRAKVFAAMGLKGLAAEALNLSTGQVLPTAQDYAERGEVYAYLGDQDLALSDLDEAIRINPSSPTYYNARAEAHAYLGNYRSALADLGAAIQRDPDGTEYLVNRGVIYDIIGDTERSLADFAAARSLDETVSPLLSVRDASYFTVYKETPSDALTAKLLLNLEGQRRGFKDIEYYSAIAPSSPDYPMAIQVLGELNLELELWQAAADRFSQLLETYPDIPEAYQRRGDAYLELQDYAQASNDYQRSVTLAPHNSDSFAARGKGYSRSGEYDLARKDFTEAIRLDGNASDAYASRGYLSVQTGEYALAFPDLDKAIEISPKNHDAHYNRAAAHSGLGQMRLALEDLDRAVELAPTNTDYLYERGLLLYELAEYPAAIENLSEAIALKRGYAYVHPRHAKPYITRGTAELRAGRLGQALADAKYALHLLSGNFGHPRWDNRRPEINLLLASGHELLGDVYTASGQPENAEAEYQLAVGLR